MRYSESIRVPSGSFFAGLGGLGAVEDFHFVINVRDPARGDLYYGTGLKLVEVTAFDRLGIEAGNAAGVFGHDAVLAYYFGRHDHWTTHHKLKKRMNIGPTGFVDLVYVEPRHAKGGLGRALLQTLLRAMRRHGTKDVLLWAYPYQSHSPSEAALIRFYESEGFKLDPSLAADGTMMVQKRRAAPRENPRQLRLPLR